MKDAFTAQERELINTAYGYLCSALDQCSMSMRPALDEALRMERREKVVMIHAKSNLLYEFQRGFLGEVTDIADIYTLRDGMRNAHILGAHSAKHYGDLIDADTRVKIKRAGRARAAEFERQMDQV